jgi:radical SAM superfamily enzyme YgiQ (UPF0313 family)
MRVKLIHPKDTGIDYLKNRRGFGYPLLTFPVLAAYTPGEVEDIEIIDEEYEEIDFDAPVDLVGITAMTYLAPRAYEIADAYRQRGVKVVMGGMHVSALPDEALQHADAVVVGEGEEAWPVVVEDFLKKELKPVYKAPGLFDMQNYRPARLDLFKKYAKTKPSSSNSNSKYANIALFEVSRGCPYNCDFCAVTHFYGKKYRFRDLNRLVEDVRSAKLKYRARLMGFVDDNLYGSKSYFKEFIGKIERLNLLWSAQVSVNVGNDPDIVKMMADSGCQGVFIGFESLSQKSLDAVNKNVNNVDHYHRLIDLMAENNIKVFPSIIFGLDGDEPDIFEKTLEFLNAHQGTIGYTTFSLITPLPGTRFYRRMLKENRILVHDWQYYNFNNVVIKPLLMSTEELQQGYNRVIEQYDFEAAFSTTLKIMGGKLSRADNVY